MQQMLDELQTISGVVGAAVFNSGEGLLANNLPRIFKPERLAAVGEQLSKLYSVGQFNFADLSDVTLNYDESVVVVRGLNESTLVFSFCDPEYNHNLLSTSLNLLQEDFLAGEFAEGGVAVGKKTTKTSVDAALNELFDLLRERLRKVVGPMADFFFDEQLEGWVKKRGDASQLDELIDAICIEIADEEKIDRYRQLIAPDLQAFQKG